MNDGAEPPADREGWLAAARWLHLPISPDRLEAGRTGFERLIRRLRALGAPLQPEDPPPPDRVGGS